MSFPYPQDRHADRKTKGEQPYADEKAAMTQTDARLQAEAEEFGENNLRESAEDRQARLEAEMAERLDDVGRRSDDGPDR